VRSASAHDGHRIRLFLDWRFFGCGDRRSRSINMQIGKYRVVMLSVSNCLKFWQGIKHLEANQSSCNSSHLTTRQTLPDDVCAAVASPRTDPLPVRIRCPTGIQRLSFLKYLCDAMARQLFRICQYMMNDIRRLRDKVPQTCQKGFH
jgi:hypothetical protein